MRLIKLVPIVGFCAVSVLPVSATADHHAVEINVKINIDKRIINAESNMCLDATSEGGFVQQSKCDKSKKAQLWTLQGSQIVNGYWKNQCLDIYVVEGYPLLNTVQTSACNFSLGAQQWEIEKSGEIQNDYTGQCLAAPGKRDLGPVKALRCKGHGGFEVWKVVDAK